MERWSGRVALVTGASAGIGKEIAKQLALKGMTVYGVARNIQKIEVSFGETCYHVINRKLKRNCLSSWKVKLN